MYVQASASVDKACGSILARDAARSQGKEISQLAFSTDLSHPPSANRNGRHKISPALLSMPSTYDIARKSGILAATCDVKSAAIHNRERADFLLHAH
jgi:hypothetical protein